MRSEGVGVRAGVAGAAAGRWRHGSAAGSSVSQSLSESASVWESRSTYKCELN